MGDRAKKSGPCEYAMKTLGRTTLGGAIELSAAPQCWKQARRNPSAVGTARTRQPNGARNTPMPNLPRHHRAQQRLKYLEPIRAAQLQFGRAFRMGHHTQHVPSRAANPGDVIQ